MAYIVADRIKETTTTQGTGAISLAGAVSGYRAFASQMSIGDTCAYAIVSATGLEWEVGIATYSAVNTLTRTTVQSSTNANALVNFSAGLKDVFLGPTAGSVPGFNPITNTITSGTWNGNTIDVAHGGTGLTALGTANQVLAVNPAGTALEYHTITSNPGTVTSVGGTGTVNGLTLSGTVTSSGNLTLGGTLSNVSLTSQVTGTLPVANGGTGVTTSTGTGGNVLSNAPTLTTATFAAGTISASTPNTITQTWNNAAVTFTGLNINVTNAASATGSFLSRIQVNGSDKFAILTNNSGYSTLIWMDVTNPRLGLQQSVILGNHGAADTYVNLASDKAIGWGNNASLFASSLDLKLYRDAAGTLAQRNGTNPQSFRVYNTYTDASNYERFSIGWSSNLCTLGFEKAGTGAQRYVSLDLGANPSAGANKIISTSTNAYDFYSAGSVWAWVANGSFGFGKYYYAGATRGVQFGESNAGASNRIGDSYVLRITGGSGTSDPGYIGFGGAFVPTGATSLTGHTQEDCFLIKMLATATPIVAFGSSFASTVPAIKRSGTQIQIRLADDSADTSISASYVKTPALTVATLPLASTAGMGSRAFVSDANATTFASIVAGGGSNKVPVYSDGTNWLIG